MLGIFACTGILLVALGVYGVLAYTVSQQTHEIAIRMALGGERGHVVRMVFRLGCSWSASAWSSASRRARHEPAAGQSALEHVTARPATLVSGVVVILVIGLFACCVPAMRAMRVEPIVALRHE